jgi:nitroreductase
MNTATKFALGLMGQLRPKPAKGDAKPKVSLPSPQTAGGMPLLEALSKRQSAREFAPTELPMQTLSNLLWAAYGFNRPEKGRTAPSALNAQEIDIYLALPSGAYIYSAENNELQLVAEADLRRITGYQDFVDEADFGRMKLVPATQRESYASVAAGAISQNVYLFAASAGLATVIRAWIDREAIAKALGLSHDHHVLLSQTVGFPK